MILNLQNVEELIFYDKQLQKLLPEFKNLFDSWTMAIRIPTLRALGKKSISDFLQGLEPQHLEILKVYFGCNIVVDKLDYRIVKNYDFQLEEAQNELKKIETFPNLVVTRDDKKIYISSWR